MANTDKDILITPNIGSSNDPKIEFKGASSTVGPSTITATIYPLEGGTLSFDGSQGSLFSISNNLTSGSIFSVNPISGIPIIDINADRTIALNPYGGNTGIGLTNPSYKLDVNGSIGVTGTVNATALVITGGRVTVRTGGVNTYGIVSGYDNNNHLMTMRASISGSTSSPTLTAGHYMCFVEYAGVNDFEGWYFKSSSSGNYEEIARITRTNITYNGNIVLHAGNYNSYAPTLTGTGASGTWGISITGNAATATIVNGTSGNIQGKDDRVIEPNSITAGRMQFGFTSWNNNDTSPWADYLHLRSYYDGSGGSDNLVMFKKDGIGMRIWQQSFGSASAYSSYVDVLHSSNYNSYAPTLTGTGASGTWGISITGNAATATTFSTNRTNYKNVTDNAVAGQLMWKAYGNNHTIFDASAGSSPDGGGVNQYNPTYPVEGDGNSTNTWGVHPVLMGWNGSSTFGVKVDFARTAHQLNGQTASYYLDTSATSQTKSGALVVGGGTGRATKGLTVAFTDNTAFSANSDAGDTVRTLSVVNESGTTNAMSVLGFRINPAGGTLNAMLDMKFVNTSGSNTSSLHYSFNHNNSWIDRFTMLSNGNFGVGTISPIQTLDVRGNFLLAADGTTSTHITQKPYTINNGTLSWEGSAGQLFSITNNLTSGSIFSVNDVSGIPSIDVDANGTILFAPYGGNIGVGTLTPAQKLHVIGSIIASSDIIINQSAISYSSSDNTAVVGSITANKLHVNGSIQLTGNNDAIVFGRGTSSFMKDEEIGFGWGGGWYMTDSTFLRVRGSKTLYNDYIIRSDFDVRAPIFRDQDDPTNFYVDPNGKSRLSSLSLSDDRTLTYPGILNLGSTEYNYNFLNGSWSSSITAGIMAHCADQWEIAIHDSGTRVVSPFLFDGGGNHRLLMGRDIGWGTMPIEAANSFRAPIFYDSNDTGYYVNPSERSRFVALETVGGTYNVFRTWTDLPNHAGFYSSVHNDAHFYPNDGLYGSWRIDGTRNGWRGLNFDNAVVLMMNDNESGHHRNGYGWQFRWNDGTMYCHKNGQGGGTSATVWDSSNAPRASNSNLMYYQGFTLDANTMDTNATGFTYSVNAPYTGPIVRFSTGSGAGYDLWLNSPYGGNGYGLAFRTRNGDTGSLNSWQYPAVYGVNVNGGGALYSTIYYDQNDTGYYLDPASTSVVNGIVSNDYIRIRGNKGIMGDYDTDGTASKVIWTIGASWPLGNMYGLGYEYGSGFDHHLALRNNGSTYSRFGFAGGMYLTGTGTATTDWRAPIFRDTDNTDYYLDPASTSDEALRIRGGALHGPNVTWGKYLLVGGNGRENRTNDSNVASVCTTNGNLHLDAASGYDTYINNYDGNNVYFGNGASGIAAQIASDGTFRSPIFYDYNDTGYYVNPNAVSRVKGLVINGAASGTGTLEQIGFWEVVDGVPNTTSAIGFKQVGGVWAEHGRTNGGYNTYFSMDSAGRGWVFRLVTGGGSNYTGTNVFSISNNAGETTIGSAWGTSNTHAILNVCGGQGSVTTYRDIDLRGSWSGGEGHAITATHGTSSSDIVGQMVFQHDGPGSRIKWGCLYHSGNQSTYPMELISESSTAYLSLSKNTASGLANSAFSVGRSIIGGLHFTNGSGTSGNGNQAAITFMGSSAIESQAGIYVHNNNSEGTHMAFCTTDSYATGPQIGLRIMNSGYSLFPRSYVEASGSFRAPIFYDSNDTNYFINPAGGNAVISRDIYISGNASGNYGNRLVVGNTDTSYTLQDTNLRPTIQAHGQYPVVSLNHTVTGNPNHGPTLQFTCNGTGNQFVIGTSGNGTFLSMGYSNVSDWNPHNGIAGHNGTSFFHANSSGYIGLGAQGDWSESGGSGSNVPGYNLHFIGSNNATGGHAALFDNRVNGTNNGSGFLFRNLYSNHSWGIVAEYRMEANGGTDRPSILFSTGYNSNTWSVGFGYTDDNFRIKYDHGHRNSGWGTSALEIDRSSNVWAFGSVRSPIFRDQDDPTNVYADFSSTSDTAVRINGGLWVSRGNVTGVGIVLADDGDIVDLNDGYCSMRFTSGVRIFSANRGGSAAITLGSNGNVTANAYYGDGSNLTNITAATATNISNTGTVTLASATEANSIYVTQPSYTTDQPVKLLNFDWYGNVWSLGNIRSGSTPSNGFGVYSSGTERARFTTSGLSAASFTSTSDIKLKTNIQPIQSSLTKLFELNGVTFEWKESKEPSIGVIAQDVEKVFPELVQEVSDHKTVNYNGLVAVLIEALKEQQEQIDELKKAIKTHK